MTEKKKSLVEKLFRRHQGGLESFFARRIRSKSNAADLAQEVYLRMLRVQSSDVIHNAEAYLFTVARNLERENAVLDRRQSAQLDVDQPETQLEMAVDDNVVDLLDSPVRVDRLREVLQQLPAKCQAAVEMKYVHDMSYEDIASQLGVSTHMVQKYLGQALALCRRRMARYK